MFIESKYLKWYYSIIDKAKAETRKKYQGIYYEKHHIIPKSIGGKNSSDNLVLLTAREHYICHLLLVKIVEDKNKYKMMCALHYLNSRGTGLNQKYNSKLYEYHRKAFIERMSTHMKFLMNTPEKKEKMRKHMSTRMNTKESKERNSQKNKNSTWMFNPNTLEESFILKTKVDLMKSKGFHLGRNPESISIITQKRKSYKGSGNPRFGSKNEKLSTRNKLQKRWITNQIEDKLVLKGQEEEYLQSGWRIGRTQSNNLGRKHKR